MVFHNLKNYDSHLILQELGRFNLKLNVISNGLEKYVSFSINNKLKFIDSFHLLSSLLDSLDKNLGKTDFKYLSQEFDNNVLDPVKQKVFYPYEYMSNFEKFKEKLTSKEKFYSSLTSKKISSKEYEHVLKVWNKFGMKTIKDHHGLYLKCDVLLLADVFEQIKNSSLKNYGLRPSYYLSAQVGMQWLIWQNVCLNLILTDPDMYIFFEKGMKGGVSYISNRYSKANNKYFKSYDPKQESKHIICLDANNLYGYGMSKFLPTSGF